MHTGQQWVGYCRPRTAAIRSLNLEVSFPAVRSRTRPALDDPLLSAASRGSGRSVGRSVGQSAVIRIKGSESYACGPRKPRTWAASDRLADVGFFSSFESAASCAFTTGVTSSAVGNNVRSASSPKKA